MAYTRAWNNAAPPGTRLAKEIDDAMREHRVDFYERMSTILQSGFDDDPWVLKSTSGGGGSGVDRKLCFGPQILKPGDDEDDIVTNQGFVRGDDGSKSLYGNLVIPIGYTIKKLEAFVDNQGAPDMNMEFYRVPMATGAFVMITNSAASGIVGIYILQTIDLNYVTVDAEQYTVRMFYTAVLNAPRFYGFRLTYHRPDGSLSY